MCTMKFQILAMHYLPVDGAMRPLRFLPPPCQPCHVPHTHDIKIRASSRGLSISTSVITHSQSRDQGSNFQSHPSCLLMLVTIN